MVHISDRGTNRGVSLINYILWVWVALYLRIESRRNDSRGACHARKVIRAFGFLLCFILPGVHSESSLNLPDRRGLDVSKRRSAAVDDVLCKWLGDRDWYVTLPQ
jgi:hypothetical protein